MRILTRHTLRFAAALSIGLCCASASDAFPRVAPGRWATRSGTVVAQSTGGAVRLTVEPDLQNDVQALLERARPREGGAVVIDVTTGRILAWASVGDGGARDFVASPSAPPASLFKVVSAATLIERARVSPAARQCYVSGIRSARLEDLRQAPLGAGVRCEPLETALGYSRNLVIGGLVLSHANASALQSMAAQLGLIGSVPVNVEVDRGDVEIPSDPEGLVRASAGFGDGRISPLAAAYMMTVLARHGERIGLSLVDGPSATQPGASPPIIGQAIRPQTAAALTAMLQVTVREGTCAKVFRDEHGARYLGGMHVAAKTGTLVRGTPERLYSWFAGFAPADHPQIAVAVMLANDQHWWQKGNQVGRDVLRAYFASNHTPGVRHPLR